MILTLGTFPNRLSPWPISCLFSQRNSTNIALCHRDHFLFPEIILVSNIRTRKYDSNFRNIPESTVSGADFLSFCLHFSNFPLNVPLCLEHQIGFAYSKISYTLKAQTFEQFQFGYSVRQFLVLSNMSTY